jgi:hypothetical protein
MTRVEEVFLEALEDLREGTGKPVERYLERVPATERRQLADLLAGFFASRTQPVDPHANAELFERTLETVDRVIAEHSGAAGILPSMLVELSRTRGLHRRELVSQLREALGLPQQSEPALAECYHRLESGQVPGLSISNRLLAGLGAVVRMPVDELEAASRRIGPPRALGAVAGFARGGQPRTEVTGVASAGEPQPPDDPGARQVHVLFYGGRNA